MAWGCVMCNRVPLNEASYACGAMEPTPLGNSESDATGESLSSMSLRAKGLFTPTSLSKET